MREAPDLPPDGELVARLRARDDVAFALVLDAWSGGMARVARSIVSTHASADEVVQDAWLAVIQGVGRFEGRSSLKTWVYRILVNAAKRRALREGRHVSWSPVAAEDDTPTVDPAR
jgi:RNA polymerase sigma-70 factor (ECF subfamily)